MVDWNENPDRATLFKGFFQIFDGATPFRFRQLQDVTIVASADSEKHYRDDGVKYKDSIGNSSSYSFTVDKTADLFDTATPGADTKTLSYFIDQIHSTPPVIPEARFQGINVTEAASNDTVTYDFQGFVEDIEDFRSPTTGVYKVRISGEIKTFNSSQRT